MIDFILLILILSLFLIGFAYLILDMKNLKNDETSSKEKQEMPLLLKRSAQFVLMAFLLLMLLNLII